MYTRQSTNQLPLDLFPGGDELAINATHFTNEILIQLRFNGELDTTYEVSQKGLNTNSVIQRPIASPSFLNNEDDEDTITDYLSDYQVITKLGNSNNMKLPVICTQIAELYNKVILSNQNDISNKNLLITLSSKLWKDNDNDNNNNNNNDFDKLIFVLKCIKDMYN
ncbi:hypothetical protein Kpol_2002p97 [Vanderwaltozyma polyspora DSM 70294]|uniref:Proteasome chaperone 3 n=1 Tax=Vanderwaltozyma polyspora (strain ATCC 22028 / DSM 70294 / BCRC 21397 / CBS 2163 / NBRC 10782 / NRRL Y-8283 / UCD 57-17) TaxID=436907 RepID=A7TFL1_VANPO|nr:uncharacterized protein Kpol_2002p97 [Vanderwaltozyma polyspora DSM 70294]EDO19025.1 hypothetical protein Kpol_2002p97 [Vanderwaltozyma polyspora DSM 70294]